MKKNAGKILRLLVIAAMTAVIIGTLGVTTSAWNGEEVTRYVGVEYQIPVVTDENEYGPPENFIYFSDPSMVLVNGEPAPEGFFKTHDSLTTTPKKWTVKFIKAGKLYMEHHWDWFDDTLEDNYSRHGKVYYTTVKEKEAFSGEGHIR